MQSTLLDTVDLWNWGFCQNYIEMKGHRGKARKPWFYVFFLKTKENKNNNKKIKQTTTKLLKSISDLFTLKYRFKGPAHICFPYWQHILRTD